MYLITSKTDNVILGMGAKLDYLPNGYPRILPDNVAFVPNDVNIYQLDTVEAGIEPYRYCYDPESGFSQNPEWVIQLTQQEKIEQLEQQVTDLQLALCDVYEQLPDVEV